MVRAFDIGGRRVGEGAPVLLVAELSANHGGRLETALATIEAAKKAGADAIKLQTYTPDTLTLRSDAPPFVVRTKNAWAGRTLHDLYAEAMTPWEWHRELRDAARSHGLLLFSTPFDPTATQFLEELDVPCHKIASFEIVDLPLVEQVARTGKPIIISTGMASLGEIEAAVAVCRDAGNSRVVLLRCVSAYPALPEAMALQSFTALAQFGTVVGLSDHTRDSTVAIASVALGARMIEKHFILDRSVGGPDAFFSLEPSEFRAMADAVRAAEAALGAPRFGPSADEAASVTFRRSLFVAADVSAGEVLTARTVRSVRPSHGLAPRHLPQVLGRRAARDLRGGQPLSWEMVGEAPPSPGLTLRPATTGDANWLLELRNDPLTRSMSLRSEPVTRAEHEAWLAATLSASDRLLWIAELEGTPVGQMRLDGAGDSRDVSLSILPAARGRGLAAAALRAAEAHAVERGLTRLVATIKVENAASVRAFEAAGYYGFVRAQIAGVDVLRCERRVRPFS